MRKFNRILIKIIFMLMLILVISTNFGLVKAKTGVELLNEMEKKTKGFIENGQSQASGNINYQNISDEFSALGQILTMIGGGVMVAVTTYMGIKYLTAGPEAQAKLKVQLVGVVVSGMVIFGAYHIWKIVIKVASSF